MLQVQDNLHFFFSPVWVRLINGDQNLIYFLSQLCLRDTFVLFHCVYRLITLNFRALEKLEGLTK